MAWLTTEEIRAKFNVQSGAQAGAIPAASKTADFAMREAIFDDSVYAEAKDANIAEGGNNYYRQNSVTQSHAYLTYYFLLKDAAHLFTKEGLLKNFQANTSAATQQVQMNTVLTPAEIAQKKNWAIENAKFFLSDYGEISLEEAEQSGEILSTLKYW